MPRNGSTNYDVTIDGKPATTSTVTLAGASYTISNLTIDGDDALLLGTNGGLVTSGLSLNGTLAAGTGGQLTVFGPLVLGTDASRFANGGTITVNADYAVTSDAQPFGLASGGTIHFNTLDTVGQTVNVANGTLSLNTLTNATGTIAVANGGTLSVLNRYTRTSETDITLVAGAAVNFAGGVNFAGHGLTVPASTNFTAGLVDNTGSTFTVSGTAKTGSILDGTVTVNAGGSLTASSRFTSTTVRVLPTGKLLVNGDYGAFTLASGTMSATSPSTVNILPGTITNNGEMYVSGTGAIGNGSVTLSGTGTYHWAGVWDAYLGSLTNDAVVKGYGRLLYVFGGGTSDTLTNHGTIEATPPASGVSPLGLGGTVITNDGHLIVDSDASMAINGQTFTSTGSMVINAGGSTTFGRGTYPATTNSVNAITNNGTITLNSANLTADSITGSGAINATYVSNLSVGKLSCGALTVGGGSSVTLQAQPAGSGIASESVGALTLASNPLTIAATASPADRIVLQVTTLTFDHFVIPGLVGKLDLNNNDLILHNAAIADVSAYLSRGYNGGTWTGTAGIMSTTASQDASRATTLGVMSNTDGSGNPVYTTFDGQPVSVGDVLVKFTVAGDADLDGGVSINDFNVLASNFGVSNGKFWMDGDFDYDGGVSINDFNLLAAGFGRALPASSEAWAGLLAFAAAHNDLVAFEQVTGVPDPSTIGVLSTGILLCRRRRHQHPVRSGRIQ